MISCILVALQTGTGALYAQSSATGSGALVIKHVNIITMASPLVVTKNATIIIKGNRIESINGPVPARATIIDAAGKWLMPGLIDMHVHLPVDVYLTSRSPVQLPDIAFSTQDIMTPFIANGVTTVLDLNSTTGTFAHKMAIERGYAIGPRIALGALINGGTGGGRIANTPEEARTLVKNAKADGYNVIKLYSQLNIETYNAIIEEANQQGMKTVGHIPNAFQGKLEQAFIPHFNMLAHAEEFSKHSKNFSAEDASSFAQLAKANGTWVTPTLTAIQWIAWQTQSLDSIRFSKYLPYVHPLLQSKWLTANNYHKEVSAERIAYFENMIAFHRKLVKALKDAGVPIVAGTDAGVSGVVGGFSLHDELVLLTEAGLTPEEALLSSTRLAAQWLGIDHEVGTIEKGKLADLVLLQQNPLDDIRQVNHIAGVVVNGRWLRKKKLDSLLNDLSQRNTSNKKNYDWQTIFKKTK